MDDPRVVARTTFHELTTGVFGEESFEERGPARTDRWLAASDGQVEETNLLESSDVASWMITTPA